MTAPTQTIKPEPVTPNPPPQELIALMLTCDNPGCKASVRNAEGKVKTCMGCRVVAYCSQACQKKDWKLQHRKLCKSFAEHGLTISSCNTGKAADKRTLALFGAYLHGFGMFNRTLWDALDLQKHAERSLDNVLVLVMERTPHLTICRSFKIVGFEVMPAARFRQLHGDACSTAADAKHAELQQSDVGGAAHIAVIENLPRERFTTVESAVRKNNGHSHCMTITMRKDYKSGSLHITGIGPDYFTLRSPGWEMYMPTLLDPDHFLFNFHMKTA